MATPVPVLIGPDERGGSALAEPGVARALRRRRRWAWLMIAAAVMSVVALVIGGTAYDAGETAFQQRSVQVTGQVLALGGSSFSAGGTVTVRFEFEGAQHTTTIGVDGDSSAYTVGQTVDILVDPADLDHAVLSGDSGVFPAWMVLLGFTALFGVLLVLPAGVIVAVRATQKRRILASGPWRTVPFELVEAWETPAGGPGSRGAPVVERFVRIMEGAAPTVVRIAWCPRWLLRRGGLMRTSAIQVVGDPREQVVLRAVDSTTCFLAQRSALQQALGVADRPAAPAVTPPSAPATPTTLSPQVEWLGGLLGDLNAVAEEDLASRQHVATLRPETGEFEPDSTPERRLPRADPAAIGFLAALMGSLLAPMAFVLATMAPTSDTYTCPTSWSAADCKAETTRNEQSAARDHNAAVAAPIIVSCLSAYGFASLVVHLCRRRRAPGESAAAPATSTRRSPKATASGALAATALFAMAIVLVAGGATSATAHMLSTVPLAMLAMALGLRALAQIRDHDGATAGRSYAIFGALAGLATALAAALLILL